MITPSESPLYVLPENVEARWINPENTPQSDPYDNTFFLFERSDDWSSCAYFYLDKATNELPPLESVEARIEGL